MGCAYYWARNDGIGGHVWLSGGDVRSLTDEMLPQGTPRPAERVAAEASIASDEFEASAPVVPEPLVLSNANLWRDRLVFLDEAARNGGPLVRC